MPDPFELSFRYTEEDYIRAFHLHFKRKLRPKTDLTVSVIAAGAGIYFLRDDGLRWLGISVIIVSTLFLLIFTAAFLFVPRFVFRREKKFRDAYQLQFSPEVIRFKTASIDSELKWELYTNVLEDRHTYLLYYGHGAFTVIPKRVFSNAAQREAFDALLTRSIKAVVRII